MDDELAKLLAVGPGREIAGERRGVILGDQFEDPLRNTRRLDRDLRRAFGKQLREHRLLECCSKPRNRRIPLEFVVDTLDPAVVELVGDV